MTMTPRGSLSRKEDNRQNQHGGGDLLTRGLTGSWKGRLRLLQHRDRTSFSHFCTNHKGQVAQCPGFTSVRTKDDDPG